MECVEQKHRSKRRRDGSKEDGFAIILFLFLLLFIFLFSLWNLEHFRDGYYSLTFLQHPLPTSEKYVEVKECENWTPTVLV
jgi:hypothetical protein